MKTIEDINLYTWFVDRNVNPCPELTPESRAWIYDKLTGRFNIGQNGFLAGFCPAFEDPKEAMMYELTWG